MFTTMLMSHITMVGGNNDDNQGEFSNALRVRFNYFKCFSPSSIQLERVWGGVRYPNSYPIVKTRVSGRVSGILPYLKPT